MRVAAFQAPLLNPGVGAMEALPLVRRSVEQCEADGVSLLCCPEAILGGLADYAAEPARVGLPSDQIASTLASLASATVTSIVGLSELAPDGKLYNAAAVYHRGEVVGLYRKHHPAIRRSRYEPGTDTPVFTVGPLTFGILLCHDSTFPEIATHMARNGAAVLFVPTNNGLPHRHSPADVVAHARSCDVARAVENGVWIVRADVAGRSEMLTSLGSTGVVAPDGTVVAVARSGSTGLVIVDIPTGSGSRIGAES
jgi:predicted amidohydrolase